MIYHIAAMASNRVIGNKNKLPWHFPADLKNFKALTTGQTVLMGRKTFESIGKSLPNRENFVLSRRPREDGPNLRFFSSIDEALESVETEHCFIIGGEEIFRLTIDLVDGIYLTVIEGDYEGDAFYPEIPPPFQIFESKLLQEHPRLEVYFYGKMEAA